MEQFHKYLSGEANQEQRSEFYNEILKDQDLKNNYLDAKNLWNLSNIGSENTSLLQKGKSFNEFWEHTQRKQNHRRVSIKSLLKYAAFFILTLSIGFLGERIVYTMNPEKYAEISEYSSAKGSLTTLVLNDGSKIW